MYNEQDLTATTTKESTARKQLRKYTAKGLVFAGEEPDVEIFDVDTIDEIKFKMIKAFNWYSYACDTKKSKSWIVDYLKSIDADKTTISAINNSTAYFSSTAGWIARLLLRDTKNLPQKYYDHLNSTIDKLKQNGIKDLEKYNRKIDKLLEGKQKAILNQRQNVQKLTDNCICDIEETIDTYVNGQPRELDLNKSLKDNKISKEQADEIIKHLIKYHALELKDAYQGKDTQLVEAYSCFSKKELKALIDMVDSYIKTCLSYKNSAPDISTVLKKPRKPRQKKIKTPKEQVKKLFYLDAFPEYNLTSINPEQIIGSEQVWVFNTKYRCVGVYYAADGSGFSVKGSTIQNFDTKISVEKKLRKPKEILSKVLESGKVALRKILIPIRCKEKKLTGRINKYTIILRAL